MPAVTASNKPIIAHVGDKIADLLLLSLFLGICAKIIWYNELLPVSIFAFVSIGGDIATVFSYLFFILFGIIYYYWHAAFFWRSLHPVNFGISLLLIAGYSLTNIKSAVGIFLGAAIGAGLAYANRQLFQKHPRRLLTAVGAYFFCQFLLFYAAPFSWRENIRHEYSAIVVFLVAAAGGFLIANTALFNYCKTNGYISYTKK